MQIVWGAWKFTEACYTVNELQGDACFGFKDHTGFCSFQRAQSFFKTKLYISYTLFHSSLVHIFICKSVSLNSVRLTSE